ncbi:uncharacterized protein N7459_000858 [Penicillium hispanicum]|uniref:uncharacterized protein n=1 Tax=Penicillium hispanicum TaxID=1080232 RepID=UPI00253F755C|nr:uncharacterized protein N7459_000858 [Penicillium hispanicum]KAJ5594650.1 hypothetical protein N7459_000858 [Penicillium hispanicum]
MSTTTTSAVATSTACGANVYELPIKDAACGAVLSGNMSDVFDSCCKGDKPVKYSSDCGIYCLAQDQTVDDLQKCLTSKSNNYRDVFCNANLNATATAAASTTKSTSTGTSTGTSTASSTKNAAPNQPISKTGLGLVAMLFCSALAGVVA